MVPLIRGLMQRREPGRTKGSAARPRRVAKDKFNNHFFAIFAGQAFA